jgi:hypothetical protein
MTGTALGISSCLFWYKVANGYTSSAGDLVPGAAINSLTDLSGNGATATLHSGKTAAKASVYNSVNQAGGFQTSDVTGLATGFNETGLPYAEILFDGTGANVYDIPVAGMPTGSGSNNNATLLVVTRAGGYCPVFLGGKYQLASGYDGGGPSSGATQNYGYAYPGQGLSSNKVPQNDVPDSYTPTVTVIRYDSASSTTKFYVNGVWSSSMAGNAFNQQLTASSGGTIGGFIGNFPGDAGYSFSAGSTPFTGYFSEAICWNTSLTDAQIATVTGQVLNGMGLPITTGSNMIAVVGDSLWKGAWAAIAGTTGIDDPYFQGVTPAGTFGADNPPLFESPTALLAKLMGPTWKIVDFALPGYMASQSAATNGTADRVAQMVGAATGTKLAIIELGSNDIGGSGATAATVEGYITTIATKLSTAGYKLIGNTITHRGTTTSTANTAIDALNTWIKGLVGATTVGTIDWAADTRLETIGPPNNNIYIRSDDNVHTRMPGTAVKVAEIAVPTINAIVNGATTYGIKGGGTATAGVSTPLVFVLNGKASSATTITVTSSTGETINPVTIGAGNTGGVSSFTPTAAGISNLTAVSSGGGLTDPYTGGSSFSVTVGPAENAASVNTGIGLFANQ